MVRKTTDLPPNWPKGDDERSPRTDAERRFQHHLDADTQGMTVEGGGQWINGDPVIIPSSRPAGLESLRNSHGHRIPPPPLHAPFLQRTHTQQKPSYQVETPQTYNATGIGNLNMRYGDNLRQGSTPSGATHTPSRPASPTHVEQSDPFLTPTHPRVPTLPSGRRVYIPRTMEAPYLAVRGGYADDPYVDSLRPSAAPLPVARAPLSARTAPAPPASTSAPVLPALNEQTFMADLGWLDGNLTPKDVEEVVGGEEDGGGSDKEN